MIKDNKVEVTIILETLSTTFFDEYKEPTKYVRTALGIEDWINRTPAANPDRFKKKISNKAIKGPAITLTIPKIIALFQDFTFNLVRAIPKDIKTKKIVA